MIRFKPLHPNIEELLPGAVRYLENQAEVRFAYLFGGLAAGRRGPLSDIDLAVYLADGSKPSRINLKKLLLGLFKSSKTSSDRRERAREKRLVSQ